MKGNHFDALRGKKGMPSAKGPKVSGSSVGKKVSKPGPVANGPKRGKRR